MAAVVHESLGERWVGLWRGPRSFTALVPMPGASVDALRERIERVKPELLRAVEGLPGLHSLRICVAPPESERASCAAVLFNSVHDETRQAHLVSLRTVADAQLAEIFGAPNWDELLASQRVRENTLHLGAVRSTVPDILGESGLRERIETALDEALREEPTLLVSPEQLRRNVRDRLRAARPDDPMLQAPPPLSFGARLLRALDLGFSFAFPAIGVLAVDIRNAIERIRDPERRSFKSLLFAAWWIYGALPTALALLAVRAIEGLERADPTLPIDEARLLRLEASEDLASKNCVTLRLRVRPTWIRRALLRVILWGSERGCRHFWTDGALAGIDTIHYARILQIESGRTMLFMSDYDGGLLRYLDDFLGIGSRAVIPISSSLFGCPPTRWLFFPAQATSFGAGWRAMIRAEQLETQVWRSAYPDLAVREILVNAEIRRGLCAKTLRDKQARRWLRRL